MVSVRNLHIFYVNITIFEVGNDRLLCYEHCEDYVA